ncbi:MAG: hypothetical protein ABJD66_02185 [Cellulophaga sp.]|uniref:hypothetical protein n=1 Tax=Cellulophaga sp. TaxID=1972202 RepID=UPI003262F6AC
MKLTKEQIEFIDDYLIKNKVKYWDVRMELLDHISNEVEALMKVGSSFTNAMQAVHVKFGNDLTIKRLNKENTGWDTFPSLYADSSGYKEFIEEKRQGLAKGFAKLQRKALKLFFTRAKSLMLYACVLITFLYTKEFFTVKIMHKTVLLLLMVMSLTPILIALFNLKNTLKSLTINAAYMSSISGISFVNLFLLGPKIFLDKGEQLAFTYIVLVLALLFPFFYTAIQLYVNQLKKYNSIHKKLV